MEHIIYKYKMDDAITNIKLPTDSQVLKVGSQNGGVVLWVLQPKDFEANVLRIFTIYGTGQTITTAFMQDYVGTVQMGDGFVWHIFEVRN